MAITTEFCGLNFLLRSTDKSPSRRVHDVLSQAINASAPYLYDYIDLIMDRSANLEISNYQAAAVIVAWLSGPEGQPTLRCRSCLMEFDRTAGSRTSDRSAALAARCCYTNFLFPNHKQIKAGSCKIINRLNSLAVLCVK